MALEPDAAFWVRAAAIRELVAARELDGWAGLGWLLWPSDDVAAASETAARSAAASADEFVALCGKQGQPMGQPAIEAG